MRAKERIGKEYNWLTVIDFYRLGDNGKVWVRDRGLLP